MKAHHIQIKVLKSLTRNILREEARKISQHPVTLSRMRELVNLMVYELYLGEDTQVTAYIFVNPYSGPISKIFHKAKRLFPEINQITTIIRS